MSSKTCTSCNTSKPTDEFYVHKGRGFTSHCKKCARQRKQAWRKANPGRNAAQLHAWYLKNIVRRQNTHLVCKFGITLEQKEAILEEQGGVCAICKTSEWGHQTPCIDHDHVTGRIRGILCTHCNSGLGRFKDDPVRLASAARYLLPKV